MSPDLNMPEHHHPTADLSLDQLADKLGLEAIELRREAQRASAEAAEIERRRDRFVIDLAGRFARMRQTAGMPPAQLEPSGHSDER